MPNLTPISSSSWDRKLLNISSIMTEPFCALSELFYRTIGPLKSNEFNFCSTIPRELGLRSVIVLGGIAFGNLISLAPVLAFSAIAVWGVVSKIFRFVGFALQKDGYTEIMGQAPEKTANGPITIMTQNCCGIPGGLPYNHGGLRPTRYRNDAQIAKILQACKGNRDPDIVVLQEIYDTVLAEEIIRKLSPHYAHFYIHLGPNLMGSVSGVMVFTKLAVHSFKSTSFDNNTWKINQIFATLKVKARPEDQRPCAAVIGTHLIYNCVEGRRVQVAQIKKSIEEDPDKVPTVLAGDLNIDRKQEESRVLEGFSHSYVDDEPTSTNNMVDKWKKGAKGVPSGDCVDYISLWNAKGGHLSEAVLVRAFDTNNISADGEKIDPYSTVKATSDHHGVIAELSLN